MKHPLWDMHFHVRGSRTVACGRLWRKVLHATTGALEVTCRRCLQTDEYLAFCMEKALIPKKDRQV